MSQEVDTGEKSILNPPPNLPSLSEIRNRVSEIINGLVDKHKGEKVVYGTCFKNGCFENTCLLKFHIKDGVITSIEPDDTINTGMAREDDEYTIEKGLIQLRPCPIGYAMRHEIYAKTRLKYPLKRIGERGEGKFVRISWEEALNTIAEKMKYVKEKYGEYSIYDSYYTGYEAASRGFDLGPWFGSEVPAWHGISSGGANLAELFHLGVKDTGYYTHDPEEGWPGTEAPNLFKSKLIILWGWNPIVNSFCNLPYYILLAKERGIPVICIEPRYTLTAHVLSDQWIPIRPMTDLAMLLAVANVLIKEDLYDKEYVAKWAEPQGFEKFKEYIMGKEDEVEKTPEWAEKICGVPAETIREFARLYARSKPTFLWYDLAVAKQHRGEYGTAMAILLQTMTGNLTVPGGSEGGSGMSTKPHIDIPLVNWNQAPPDYEYKYTMAALKWAKCINMRDKYDKGQITKEEFFNEIGNAADNPAPNIQMVIFENNWLNNLHGVNERIEAIKKVDFVWGWQWHSNQPTMKWMDIVLPSPDPSLETMDGILSGFTGTGRFIWAEGSGIRSYLFNYWIYARPCIEPQGEIRPKYWVWTELAKRLGIVKKFNPRMTDVPLEKWREGVENLHKEAYEKWAAREEAKALVGDCPSWEQLLEKPIVRVPIDEPHYQFQNLLEQEKNPFKTPSKKVEFYSNLAAKTDFPKSRYGGKYSPIPQWEPSYMPGPAYNSFFHPKAQNYPLLLVTPVSIYRNHSANFNNEMLRGECYRHAVWISVSDAKTRNLKDGDLVRVYSDTGEIIIPAHVTSRMVPGVVCIHHGAWYTPNDVKTDLMPYGIDRGGNANILLEDKHLPHVVGTMLNTGLVQIERFEEVK